MTLDQIRKLASDFRLSNEQTKDLMMRLEEEPFPSWGAEQIRPWVMIWYDRNYTPGG